MAFTVSEKIVRSVFGNKRVHMGSFTGGAPTGGTIATGLRSVEHAEVTGATALSASAGTLTVTSAATAGFWKVIGY